MKRRAFLLAGSLGAGGLLVGLVKAGDPAGASGAAGTTAARGAALGPWLRVDAQGRVTVRVPHIDMGQGTHTALAMMLADEMDADWDRVVVEQAPADPLFANRFLAKGWTLGDRRFPALVEGLADSLFGVAARMRNLQLTGGSISIRFTGHVGMRVLGAGARSLMLDAAAARWQVPRGELVARRGQVQHAVSGRHVDYGDLAPEAARHRLPARPVLKPPAQWTLMGTSPPRRDIPRKVDGTAPYDIDLQLPDMCVATVKAAPVHGERLQSVDKGGALAVPGVLRVVALDDAVAVVGDGFWAASRGLAALTPVWADGGHRAVDDAALQARQSAALGQAAEPKSGHATEERGDASGELAAASPSRVLRASYQVPLLYHAALQPLSGCAQWTDGRLTVWAGEQNPLGSKAALMAYADLPAEQVVLHPMPAGGAFGRRSGLTEPMTAHLKQLVVLAREMSPRPVKLIWSRQEDIAQGTYRPAVACELRAVLGDDGLPRAWWQRLVRHSSPEPDYAQLPYDIPHQSIREIDVPRHVHVGSWRAVNNTQTKFFIECFADELAQAARKDPLAWRLALLGPGSRGAAVLERAARASGWGTPVAPGRARGLALNRSHGTWVAVVAELSATPEGRPRVHRLTAAVDCGPLVHPENARAQVEGGLLMGLSAALFERVTIAQGAVRERGFGDYRILRLRDTPELAIEFVNGGPVGGLGEPPVPAVAPAVANAWSTLIGRRVRSLPLMASPGGAEAA